MCGLITYKEFRTRIKAADLIEFSANSTLGYSIRKVTGKIVNHTTGVDWMHSVENAFHGNSSNRMRLYIGEAIDRGFVFNWLSYILENYDGSVYWIKLKDKYDNYRLQIVERAHSLEGRPYDYKSLIRNLWMRVPLDDKKPYCSEAWHIALRDVGLIADDFSPTGKDKDKGCGLRPGEFGMTGLFEDPICIYDYKNKH